MERNFKNHPVTNEETKSKKTVLETFHHMEWMKNKSGSQLSRSDSRGNHEARTKKKDEDNYFEGTGNQKKGRVRRPRPVEQHKSAPVNIITTSSGPRASGPPPVNAWSQKRGSDLFTKPRGDVEDEDDQMLKLALQESLKTAKAEEERMKMMNKFEACQLEGRGDGQTQDSNPPHVEERPQFWLSAKSKPKTDDENWEDRFGDDNEFCGNTVYVNQSKKCELRFIDTDSSTEKAVQPERKKLLLPRKLKTCTISSDSSKVEPVVNNKTRVYSPDPPSSIEVFGKTQYGANDYYSKQQAQESSTLLESRKEEYGPTVESLTYNNNVPISQSNQAIIFPEKKPVVNNLDLAEQFSSNLAFGDTQDLFDQIKEDITFSSKTLKYPFQSQDYTNNQVGRPSQFLPETHQTRRDSVSSESAETDLILHQFIRRDPPSLTLNHGSVQKSSLPNEISSINNDQQYTPTMDSNFVENQQFINGFGSGPAKSLPVPNNGQGSSSSLASDSPLQSPFGTPQSRQSFPFPPPLVSQPNPGPAPPGYNTPTHQMLQQMAGFPQYRPPLPVIDITNPQLYHAQLQNMIAINMYQQAQLAALRANEEQANNSPEGVHSQNLQVLKNGMTQDTIPPHFQSFPIQNQPQINPTQSQILQPQNLPPLQVINETPQIFRPDILQPQLQKQEGYRQDHNLQPQGPQLQSQNLQPLQVINETPQIFRPDILQPQLQKQEGYPQDHNLQQQGPQLQSQNLPRTSFIHNLLPQQAVNQPHQIHHEQYTPQNNQIIQQNDKTELQQELNEVMQRLQQIQQAMGCSQITNPPVPIPQQSFVYPQAVPVPMNGYYPAVGVVPSTDLHSHEQVSQNVDEQRPSLPSPQPQLEPHVGRGRGRLPH